MYETKTTDTPNQLADGASRSAQDAIKTTQGMVNNALNSLADSAQELRDGAAPVVNRVTDQASALVQRGTDALRDRSQQLRNSARDASDYTVSYIRDEPVKSMLMAAATGAALMALVGLMARSSRH